MHKARKSIPADASPGRAIVQPSLQIGQPGDRYEQEADAVADQVVTSPGTTPPALQRMALGQEEEEGGMMQMKPFGESPSLQMKCAACEAREQDEEVQRKPMAIQRKEGGGMTASPEISQQLSSRAGRGATLPDAVNEEMSSKIGADFSKVRVHTDQQAVQMSQDLGARAFTHGNDIYFNSGQYDPGSKTGKHLLAHELTHTVQQSGGIAPKMIQRVLGPPYPFEGIVTARYSLALRSTPDDSPGAGNYMQPAMPRNTRVTVLRDNGAGWLRVRTTTDGQVREGWAGHRYIDHLPAGGFAAPAAQAGGRQEVTDYGTYNIYSNLHTAHQLGPNELYTGEFTRLETVWNHVENNTGGLLILPAGTADAQTLIDMIGREMARSQTFRNLIVEIVEDTAHPVTVNVGRNNAFWGDSFGANTLDLRDIEYSRVDPNPAFTRNQVQGERLTHILVERRHRAVTGNPNFAPAHNTPFNVGGAQQQFMSDLGQPDDPIVGQTAVAGAAPGLIVGQFNRASGASIHIVMDNSGGDPTPLRYNFINAAGATVDTRFNNVDVTIRKATPGLEIANMDFEDAGGANMHTEIHGVNTVPNNFSFHLEDIAPMGGHIAITTSDTLPIFPIDITQWNHPFNDLNYNFMMNGDLFDVNVALEMDP